MRISGIFTPQASTRAAVKLRPFIIIPGCLVGIILAASIFPPPSFFSPPSADSFSAAIMAAEQAKLTDTMDGEMNERLGFSVAVSADTAIVGVPSDDAGGNQRGSALVFARNGSMWSLQQRLTAADSADGDMLGFSVAIDGDTAVISARNDDITVGMTSNADQGSVYVFTRSMGVWSQQGAKLTASDGAANDLFGHSVAVDGDTLIAGAFLKDAAYVFTRSGGVWTEQQKLVDDAPMRLDAFGRAVDVEADTAIVGAQDAQINMGNSEGAAFVFTRSGGVWTQQQKLSAMVPVDGDRFGASVGLSGDSVIVGAPSRGAGAEGSAVVFTRSGMMWTEQQELSASDGAVGDEYGSSVAIDDDRAVVGAHFNDATPSDNQGAAYFYERAAGVWGSEQKLAGSDSAAGDEFGTSAGINGGTIIVGAPLHNIMANNDQGAAYIFNFCIPTEQAKLTDTMDGEMSERLGASVAISGDTAIVGVPLDDAGGNQRGSALVFVRSGSMWSLQQRLTASDGEDGDRFGHSVAIDGDTAVIGAQRDDITVGMTINANQGSAYVFTRSMGVWSQQGAKLTASDGAANDLFGNSVGLDSDTLIVGTFLKNAAYVFTRSGGVWTQQQKLTASDGTPGDEFGFSADVDADTAIVGARREINTMGGIDQGAAYVFVRSGGVWTEQQKLLATTPNDNDFFGISVAISGESVIVGAPGDDQAASDGGAAYVFTRSGMTWTLEQQLTASDAGMSDEYGFSVDIEGNRAIVGAHVDDAMAPSDEQGSAYFYERAAGVWGSEQKLTGSDSATGDQFGESVGTSGGTAIVGAPFHNIMPNDDQGAAYVFILCLTQGGADLQISKTDSPDPVNSGGSLTYTLTVTNNGPDDATGVVATDTLPSGVNYVSDTCGAGPPAGNILTWNIGNLANGAMATCQVTVTVSPIMSCSAMISNGASVTANEPDSNAGNNSDTEDTTVVNSPTISCPANITVSNDSGQCSASVAFMVTAAGSPSPTVECKIGMTVITSPHTFPVGTTTVDCTAMNGCLPNAACSFTVTVNDTQPPSITCPPTQVAAPGVVNYPNPAVTDNCPGASFMCNPPSGSVFPAGATTVTCTATDAASNTAQCSFNVVTFDICMRDDSGARLLRFSSTTGDWEFCTTKGPGLTGKGVITRNGCKIFLNQGGAKGSGVTVSATANTCTRVGTATVTASGVMHKINDSDMSNSSCACP